MTTHFRKYGPDDFLRIRDFISANYTRNQTPNSWLIDRWEFVPYVQETINGTLAEWEDLIGVWSYDSGGIAAVACTDGDAYFLLDTLEPTERLMSELLDYAEARLAKVGNGVRMVRVSIPDTLAGFMQYARSRGYTENRSFDSEAWSEHIISIDIDRWFDATLPPGFTLGCGGDADGEAKALGHIMAFDYPGTPQAESALRNYGNMKNAPDYRPELDLFVMDPAGRVVSFCNLWLDSANGIAVFEPVGTHKDFRKLGLARAVMHEGLNRVGRLGATKAFVGADQPFYRALGFKRVLHMTKWDKVIG